MKPSALHLFDDLEVDLTLLDVAVHAVRVPLASARPPASAGVYLVFGLEVPPYASNDVRLGRWPLYVGVAADLEARRRRHGLNAMGVRDLADGDRLWLSWVALGSDAESDAGERLLINRLQPVWNQTWLRGFGSRFQGIGRSAVQAPNPWCVVHPGRRAGQGAVRTPRPELVRRANDHLAQTARPLWPTLAVA